jgi:predicted DNA-binding transcriptional regulator YafY
MAAARVERLTNLLALLLETPHPLSLVEIAGELAGQYPDGQTARRGAFERDKAALREIGVPIEQEIVPGGEYAGQTRYWIDRERYELRGLELDEDEARALQVAMAATRPGSRSGQEALWKLGAGALDSSTPIAAVLPDLDDLPLLREAVATRTAVRFEYRQVERTVEPWGLLLKNGFWYMIGLDRARGERRTFRIDRVEGPVTLLPGERFERPQGFDPRDTLPDDPKMIGATDEVTIARVRIDAAAAGGVVGELGEQQVTARGDDGSIEVEVPFASLPAFRSWVLGYLDQAEVLAPDDLRAHLFEWLSGVGR